MNPVQTYVLNSKKDKQMKALTRYYKTKINFMAALYVVLIAIAVYTKQFG